MKKPPPKIKQIYSSFVTHLTVGVVSTLIDGNSSHSDEYPVYLMTSPCRLFNVNRFSICFTLHDVTPTPAYFIVLVYGKFIE